MLKVPSGQIGSAWEWYHWKALEKDINRYMFLIFYFWSWIFYKSSNFWAAPCQKESNLLLVRFMDCIESCLPIGWRTVTWWKNPPKSSSFLVRIAECWSSSLSSRNPKDLMSLPHFWGTVWRKRSRLEHMQTVNRTSRRTEFNSAWSGSGLWSLLKYSRVK